jgi:enoyl-CoA hydratase/carnithine racemase
MTNLSDYCNSFAHVAMRREDGILEVRLHTDGGPVVWTHLLHQELPVALSAIARDPSTRLVIFTGTGDAFSDRAALDDAESPPLGEGVARHGWTLHEKVALEGRQILDNLLDIEVPIIAAVNGPATIHAELALLSDIVLASHTAVFMDAPHFSNGVVPGDGVHVIWPMLIGPNRARYFLLTGQQITAAEAKTLGFVAEVLAPNELLSRAWELARQLNTRPRLTLRYSRQLLTYRFKKSLLEELPHGVALEGIAKAAFAADERARVRDA